jgi:acetoin utilization protein AcuB
MVANELINFTIPSLKPTDSVEKAIHLMEFYHVNQLVLADQDTYFGVFDLEVLENESDQDKFLVDLMPNYIHTYALESQHLYELIAIVNKNSMEVLAILDQNLNYKGCVLKNDLVYHFSNLLSNDPGAILVLNIDDRDYSLAEIARHVEANDTKILSSFLSKSNNSEMSNTLTLKLNKQEISRAVSTLERFGYNIAASFANNPIESVEKERYEMLIKYLEI